MHFNGTHLSVMHGHSLISFIMYRTVEHAGRTTDLQWTVVQSCLHGTIIQVVGWLLHS